VATGQNDVGTDKRFGVFSTVKAEYFKKQQVMIAVSFFFHYGPYVIPRTYMCVNSFETLTLDMRFRTCLLFSCRSDFFFFYPSSRPPDCFKDPSFLMFDTEDIKLSGYQVYISVHFLFCQDVITSLITYIWIQSHSSSCGISGRRGGILKPFSILQMSHFHLLSGPGTIGPLGYVVRRESVLSYSYD